MQLKIKNDDNLKNLKKHYSTTYHVDAVRMAISEHLKLLKENKKLKGKVYLLELKNKYLSMRK